MNKHLNLFYSYKTNHLEDNVTRALLITAKNLSPITLRLFLLEVLNSDKNSDRSVLLNKLQILPPVASELGFDTQISGIFEDDDKKLTNNTGIIIGITYSGTKELNFTQGNSKIMSGSRLDGLIVDHANDFCFIFESKLWDNLYKSQIEKYFNAFFDVDNCSIDDVFIEINWTQLNNILLKISSMVNDEKEKFVIREFMNYCDMLGLTEFIRFTDIDFADKNSNKLGKFLSMLSTHLHTDLGVVEYKYNNQLWFENLTLDNLYFYYGNNNIVIGIVCGSGKKWRAERAKNFLKKTTSEFQNIIDTLEKDIPQKNEMWLTINSSFRYSRFRTEWLGEIGGKYGYPDRFKDFISNFTDDTLNKCGYYSKEEINKIFAKEIIANDRSRDKNGLFPAWEDIDDFLQYAYFHIDISFPKEFFIKKDINLLITDFKGILSTFKVALKSLEKI